MPTGYNHNVPGSRLKRWERWRRAIEQSIKDLEKTLSYEDSEKVRNVFVSK